MKIKYKIKKVGREKEQACKQWITSKMNGWPLWGEFSFFICFCLCEKKPKESRQVEPMGETAGGAVGSFR